MRIEHELIEIDTGEGIAITDLTPAIEARLAASGIRNGFVLLSSRHTTTALTVNEHETRLLDDIRACFQRLVPNEAGYKHKDIPCATARRTNRKAPISTSSPCFWGPTRTSRRWTAGSASARGNR